MDLQTTFKKEKNKVIVYLNSIIYLWIQAINALFKYNQDNKQEYNDEF